MNRRNAYSSTVTVPWAWLPLALAVTVTASPWRESARFRGRPPEAVAVNWAELLPLSTVTYAGTVSAGSPELKYTTVFEVVFSFIVTVIVV
jgi:hypothetical protein